MLKIGLTGGIGSGKSTVAELFAQKGVPVIDTDQVAREVVQPGSKTLKAITTHFGSELIGPNGELDRAQLRTQIFQDSAKRAWLEALLHPLIWQSTLDKIAALSASTEYSASYVLIVVPLLFESGLDQFMDRTLAVDCEVEQQIKRVLSRDTQSTREEVESIIAVQINSENRRRKSTDIVQNNHSLAALETEVSKLDHKFRLLISKMEP